MFSHLGICQDLIRKKWRSFLFSARKTKFSLLRGESLNLSPVLIFFFHQTNAFLQWVGVLPHCESKNVNILLGGELGSVHIACKLEFKMCEIMGFQYQKVRFWQNIQQISVCVSAHSRRLVIQSTLRTIFALFRVPERPKILRGCTPPSEFFYPFSLVLIFVQFFFSRWRAKF